MDTKRNPSLLGENIRQAGELLESLKNLEQPLIAAAELVVCCLRAGGKLLICGNGGSACDAAHLTTEFVVRFQDDRPPYAAICLNDSGATLTAGGNDYGFENVFARQVRALGRRGDVLIVLSTSGQSANVLLAMEAAREVGLASISFLGKTGGSAKGRATVELLVSHPLTARIQEAHLLLYHTLCEMAEKQLADT